MLTASFVSFFPRRRWRAVQKKAVLQKAGVRSLWKLNAHDKAEPLDLLMNDMPSVAEREWAASVARPPRSSMTKDPSLASMLLADAVVC